MDTYLRQSVANGVRELNTARILDHVERSGAVSRRDLITATGLSRTTVSALVADLLASGTLVEAVPAGRVVRAGRPATLLELAPSQDLAIAVDFGHSHCTVAVADRLQIFGRRTEELDVGTDADEALGRASSMARELIGSLDAARYGDVVGMGIGVPAPVDQVSGRVGSGNILPDWVGRQLSVDLSGLLGVPGVVDNDANLACLGELNSGAGQGLSDLVYVKVSAGIGAGLILDGRLYRGRGGLAGEIGHVPVDDRGDVCRCGNRGCLETVASMTQVLAALQPGHQTPLDATELLRLLTHGDDGAVRVLGDTGLLLGRVLADVANTLNPEAIIIGGELANAGSWLLDPIRQGLRRTAQPEVSRQLTVLVGDLGADAPLRGAIDLALSTFGNSRPDGLSRGASLARS